MELAIANPALQRSRPLVGLTDQSLTEPPFIFFDDGSSGSKIVKSHDEWLSTHAHASPRSIEGSRVVSTSGNGIRIVDDANRQEDTIFGLQSGLTWFAGLLEFAVETFAASFKPSFDAIIQEYRTACHAASPVKRPDRPSF